MGQRITYETMMENRKRMQPVVDSRIKEALDENSDSLDLSYCELTEVPEKVRKLKGLKTLNLSVNFNLPLLPEWIGELSKLEELNLERMNLKGLPNSIGKLKELRRIIVKGSSLWDLPDSFGNLAKLEYLNLDYNDITELPDSICDLKKLSRFNINYNSLTNLPKDIGNLKNLKNLNISGNRLESIPESIGGLSSLARFNLKNNNLQSLPKEIINLPESTVVLVNDNPLETPPLEIASRGLESIRTYFHGKSRNILTNTDEVANEYSYDNIGNNPSNSIDTNKDYLNTSRKMNQPVDISTETKLRSSEKKIKSTIFISYRRKDTLSIVGRIYDRVSATGTAAPA